MSVISVTIVKRQTKTAEFDVLSIPRLECHKAYLAGHQAFSSTKHLNSNTKNSACINKEGKTQAIIIHILCITVLPPPPHQLR